MTSTVEIVDAAKRYGKVEAVRNVSFTLHEGETVALVGHNGAGKTTLIKMMLGLIRPTKGSVKVLGEDPASGNFSIRQRLGYLPESVSFHMALTGRETLAFYARLKNAEGQSANELFERVGLARSAADRPVRTYSKGMRQRLGLAQALLGQPRMLLLDEPTSGLDPALRRHFYDLIDELRVGGATVLLSSHALTELEDRAGRVIIVNQGVKIADGTLDDLRKIAQLPTLVRIRPTAGLAAVAGGERKWRATGDGSYETEIRQEDKIGILHGLTANSDAISNLTIVEPTLDDLYAHFLSAQEVKQ